MVKKRAPLVEVSARYQAYSEWLNEQDERYSEIPPDHLQVAVQRYAAFQKSPENKKGNAERAAEAAPKPAKAKKGGKAAKPVESDDDDDESDDDDDEDEAPAKRPPAKKVGRGKAARAAF